MDTVDKITTIIERALRDRLQLTPCGIRFAHCRRPAGNRVGDRRRACRVRVRTMMRERLQNRRAHTLLDFESMGMRFTAGVGRYPDGRISELFLDNHKAGSAIGTLVRDLAIVFSFATQHGADPEAIRKALCRDSLGRALGPLGAALDALADNT
jgi:hypothetical protein